MTGPLTRVRDFYVAPSPMVAPARVRGVAPPPAGAVLGRPRDTAAVAAGLALAVASAGGWPCAVVATWRTGEGHYLQLPARPAARRVAARLDAQGLDGRATGRLATLSLPDCPRSAVAEAERATGITRAPVVLALAGPRDPDIDALLRVQDVIVLACRPDDDPAVADLAAASLSGLAAPVLTSRAACSPAARALALAGATAPSGLRRALAVAVREVA